MNQWEGIMQKANQYFDEGKACCAITYYEHARVRAETIFYQWYKPADVVAALVLSYHNLAQVHVQQHELKTALVITQIIHNIVVGSLARQKICSARREALISASYRTSAEVIALEKKANLQVDISASGLATFTPLFTSISSKNP